MIKIRTVYYLFSFILSALLMAGCGYKPFTPTRDDIKNICVPTFKNSTYYPNVSAVITDAIRREIILDGSFKLTNEKNAHASLTGEIKSFKRTVSIYDEEDNVIGGALTIEIKVRFVSIPQKEILWEGNFRESESVNYFLAGSLAKTEDEVTKWVAEKTARKIIERITEPW